MIGITILRTLQVIMGIVAIGVIFYASYKMIREGFWLGFVFVVIMILLLAGVILALLGI